MSATNWEVLDLIGLWYDTAIPGKNSKSHWKRSLSVTNSAFHCCGVLHEMHEFKRQIRGHHRKLKRRIGIKALNTQRGITLKGKGQMLSKWQLIYICLQRSVQMSQENDVVNTW